MDFVITLTQDELTQVERVASAENLEPAVLITETVKGSISVKYQTILREETASRIASMTIAEKEAFLASFPVTGG